MCCFLLLHISSISKRLFVCTVSQLQLKWSNLKDQAEVALQRLFFFFSKVIYFCSSSTKLSYCWVIKLLFKISSWWHVLISVRKLKFPIAACLLKAQPICSPMANHHCCFILVWWGSFTTTFFPFRLDTIHFSISFKSIFFLHYVVLFLPLSDLAFFRVSCSLERRRMPPC